MRRIIWVPEEFLHPGTLCLRARAPREHGCPLSKKTVEQPGEVRFTYSSSFCIWPTTPSRCQAPGRDERAAFLPDLIVWPG